MTAHALDAWLYGTRIARLTAGTDDRVHLVWFPDATRRWGDGARVLSHLLPMQRPGGRATHPARATAWIDGLMPEGRTRGQMALEAGIDPDDTVGFFRTYGGDTAGAVVFTGADQPPPTTRAPPPDPLTEPDIGALLREAVDRAGGIGRSHRLTSSLPGMEPKITLVRGPRGEWARPCPGYPSTHILKVSRPADSQAADLVDTEAAALDLARRIGLTTVDADVRTFDGERCIVVSRYDRVPGPAGLTRLHQEDTAQALGINTRDPERKFQHGRALPSLAHIAATLRDDGARPDGLLALTTFNLAIGNTDAHAKNISILRHDDGTAALAPAYDVSMHLHHRHASRTFAMDVAGTRDMPTITAHHLVDEGTSWGLPRRRAHRAVAQTLDALHAALDDLDRDAHPGVPPDAWTTVETRTATLALDAARTV